MAVAKRQKKGKVHKNRTKENPRTGVRTSGETNSPPGQPNLHRAGSGGWGGGGYKCVKGESLEELRPFLRGQPALMPQGYTILCLPNKTLTSN